MTIKTSGYIINNETAIWGYGATADAAWIFFMEEMEKANVEADQNFREDFACEPATADLISAVESRGGAISWEYCDGIACTADELDDA